MLGCAFFFPIHLLLGSCSSPLTKVLSSWGMFYSVITSELIWCTGSCTTVTAVASTPQPSSLTWPCYYIQLLQRSAGYRSGQAAPPDLTSLSHLPSPLLLPTQSQSCNLTFHRWFISKTCGVDESWECMWPLHNHVLSSGLVDLRISWAEAFVFVYIFAISFCYVFLMAVILIGMIWNLIANETNILFWSHLWVLDIKGT